MWESADAERNSPRSLSSEFRPRTRGKKQKPAHDQASYIELVCWTRRRKFLRKFSTKGDFYYNLMLIRTPKSFPVCGRRQVTCPLLNVRCSIKTLAGQRSRRDRLFGRLVLPRRIFFIIKNLKEKRSTKREMIKRKRKTTKGGEAKKWYTLKYFIGLLASADYFNSNYFGETKTSRAKDTARGTPKNSSTINYA